MSRTLEQKRAQHALDKVRSFRRELSAEDRQKFVSYVESLPANIMANGLGQAMAMLLAQAKGAEDDPHCLVYKVIQEWLTRNEEQAPYRQERELMDAIVSRSRADYLRAQTEALSYLEWLKKFAVAMMKEKT